MKFSKIFLWRNEVRTVSAAKKTEIVLKREYIALATAVIFVQEWMLAGGKINNLNTLGTLCVIWCGVLDGT